MSMRKQRPCAAKDLRAGDYVLLDSPPQYFLVTGVQSLSRLRCVQLTLLSATDKQEVRFFDPERRLHVWRVPPDKGKPSAR